MSQNSDTLYQSVFFTEPGITNLNDSVLQQKSYLTQSLFSTTTKTSQPFIKVERPKVSGIEPFWILLGSLLVFAFINLVFHKYYKYKILGFFYSKYKSLNLEKEDRNKLLSRFLSLIFFFNIALFVYLAIPILNITIPEFFGIPLYWTIFLFVIAFSFIKSSLLLGTSLLFTNFDEGWALLRINNESQWVMTILLLPLNFLLNYTFHRLEMIYIIASILMIIFTIKQFRLYSKIRLTSSYYTYQIILYLCILEILPLMVIFRYLTY